MPTSDVLVALTLTPRELLALEPRLRGIARLIGPQRIIFSHTGLPVSWPRLTTMLTPLDEAVLRVMRTEPGSDWTSSDVGELLAIVKQPGSKKTFHASSASASLCRLTKLGLVRRGGTHRNPTYRLKGA